MTHHQVRFHLAHRVQQNTHVDQDAGATEERSHLRRDAHLPRQNHRQNGYDRQKDRTGEFNPAHVITIQAGFESKKIVLPDNKRVELAIWDTAGQERFHTLGVFYYRNSNGAILVYDITDKNSFDRVQTWVKELHKIVGPDIVLAIVGNKIDLERNRTVSKEEAEKYSVEVGAVHYQCSAKLNTGVKEMFSDLTRRIVLKDNPATKDTGTGFNRTSSKRGGVQLEEHQGVPTDNSSSTSCCGGSTAT